MMSFGAVGIWRRMLMIVDLDAAMNGEAED